MKRILILYTSIGLGHKMIAENIADRFSALGYEVKTEDILVAQGGPLVDWSKRIHFFINQYVPFVWSFLYKSKWFTDLTLPYRTKIAAKNYENTKFMIDSFSPDLVVTTQTTASAVVAYLKQAGLYRKKFAIAFSDYHLHRYWLYDEADAYLVNIPEQKQQMVRLGVPEKSIFVCGMTLKPAPVFHAEGVRKKLGITPIEQVVLIASGSLGIGINENLVYRLASHPQRKVIVVCGKNESAFKHMNEKFAGSPVLVLGYYTPMEELYAISELFITKPGGLSVAESVRAGLPMLISHTLPGQEELNFEYLKDKGLVMPEPFNIEGEVAEELVTHAFRRRLVANPARSLLLPGPERLAEAAEYLLGQSRQATQ